MKKLFLLTSCLIAVLWSKAQQNITFSEYFDYYTGYCPGDPQYDNWVSFRGSLDTTVDKFLKITMKGTYDMQGKSCSDKYVVRQIADALYNGYDLSIQCGNDMWYVGTGCSDYNCGNYTDYVELTTNQWGTCNCGNAYTIRPGMTSPNWGGINTETCQWWYQNANQTMIAEVLRLYQNNNLAVMEFINPDECVNTQDLKIKVMNLGNSNVSNYNIGFKINGTLQTPVAISNSINSEEEQIITFSAGYTFTPSTIYDFEVWTYDPNSTTDDFEANDTVYFTYKHTGSPDVPTAVDVNQCGNGIAQISASSSPSDSIIWYDASSGGNILGLGENYQTPYLTQTTSFYAEANAFKSSINVLSTGFHNYTMLSYDPSNFNGNMFDFKANSLINVNGIKVQALFGNTAPYYRVYIKEGTYLGSERSQSNWTLIFSDYIYTSGDNMNTIPVQFIPEPGKTYGIYVTTDPTSGEDQWAMYGNATYANSDLSISGGCYSYGLFGSIGIYSPYMVDAEILYSTACVSASRKQVTVNVNPKPSGSELVQGSPFEGRYNLGLISQPDVVEVNKTLTYELTNPSNYTNAGYGTTWEINSVLLTSEYGVPVDPSLYSFVDPSAGSNGILTFKADNSVLDSNILMLVNYQDLGPYFCDTLITRVVHIAPTPKPSFNFDNVLCDGVDVAFGNKSTIHSGFMTYKWFFDDGDSSNSYEPTHLYNTFGSYNVRLEATSTWGIVKDTIIVVNINEVPSAKFKVINACEGVQVSYINQTTIGSGVITYDWNFGDNTANSALVNPKHTYSQPGGYVVLLKANSNGCVSEAKRNAYQFATPVADFTVPSLPVCANSEFTLPNNSTIALGSMGSSWNYHDNGQISTLFTGEHSYNTPGVHNITLTMISEFGCTDSISKNITVKPTPVVDFSVDKLCDIDPSRFTNLSTEFPGITSVYNWSFSDGTSYSTKDVVKTWDLIGSKTVTLQSNLSNGCYSELTKTFDVLTQPFADFSTQDICSGEEALFVNKSTASQGVINCSWNFGDASPVVADYNPSHTYTVLTTTTFMVSLITKVAGGCDDTARRLINVTEIPNCNFTFSSYYVTGNRGYKFTPANSSYSKYEWYFGDGGSSALASPIYQYLFNGVFKVKLIAHNAAGCDCESIQTINAEPSGLTDTELNNIRIFPNPANNQFSIEIAENMVGASMELYNSVGQLITGKVLSGQSTLVETEHYNNGFYMVKIVKDDQSYNFKIVVNH